MQRSLENQMGMYSRVDWSWVRKCHDLSVVVVIVIVIAMKFFSSLFAGQKMVGLEKLDLSCQRENLSLNCGLILIDCRGCQN